MGRTTQIHLRLIMELQLRSVCRIPINACRKALETRKWRPLVPASSGIRTNRRIPAGGKTAGRQPNKSATRPRAARRRGSSLCNSRSPRIVWPSRLQRKMPLDIPPTSFLAQAFRRLPPPPLPLRGSMPRPRCGRLRPGATTARPASSVRPREFRRSARESPCRDR
jgi:hypothetical protein